MSYALFNGSYIGKKNTGIGVVARDLSKHLSRDIVTSLEPFESNDEVNIQIPSNLSPEHGKKGHLRRLIWLQMKIPELMRKNNSEFFISPLPEAPLFSGVRSIVIAHDLIPLRYPKLNSLFAYNLTYIPAVLHQAEIILCNSDATAREIINLIRVNPKKVFTIKLGFDKSLYYPKRLNRENFLLVLGRHSPHKNLKIVLRSFSKIKDKDHKLIFAGPYNKRYTSSLKKLAKELEILDRCEWISWVSDEEKLLLLNKCKGLVMASLWEGFGLPALEALACGTPVIASNRGGLPEVVGDCGILVDPLNCDEIKEAMNEVIDNSLTSAGLSFKGPERAAMFDWQETASEVQNILMSLK